MSGDADERDVASVLAGDASSFEGIVRRWQGPLVNLAYRFCHERARAEELAQEAFLRAFRGLPRWRREAAFSTWLFALAVNLYRSELRRVPPPLVPLDERNPPADPRSEESRLQDASRDRAVRRAVDSLPARYRDTLVLFYFHGLGVPATAKVLKLPEGTVKARLFRARALLRRKLEAVRE